MRFKNTRSGDVIDVPPTLDARYAARADMVPLDDDLKGKALDTALKDAGLTISGSADTKRERLAAHQEKENTDG